MFIRDFAYSTPQWKVTSEEVATWTGSEELFITEKVGIKERRYLSPEESLVSLAVSAVAKLFAKHSNLEKSKIDGLVLVTQNPDFKIPHSSALLHAELGLNTACATFDISLGCSGWVYAMSVAKGLMAVQGLENVLVVTCDPYSRIMGRSDKSTVPVFGDAAAVTWLSSERGAEIGKADLGSDGSQYFHLMVKAGGSRFPLAGLNEKKQSYSAEDHRLQMNGRAILEFMVTRVPESLDACLRRNEMSLADVDYFVFHQASAFMLGFLRKKLGLPAEKMPVRVESLGNTVSSTIPIVLSQLKEEGLLQNKVVVVSGFGVGLSWATNIIRFGS